MIKVLWFTNTPSGASQYLNSTNPSGGWLLSLEKHIKDQQCIELHVAFYYNEKLESFYYNGVTYHPIFNNRHSSKWNTLLNNYHARFCRDTNSKIEALIDLVHKVTPDIIHIHGSENNFGLLQKTITNIPTILSIQGILNIWNEKKYAGVPKEIQRKYESIITKIACAGVSTNDRIWEATCEREREILNHTKYIIGRTDFDRHAAIALAPNAKYYIGNELLREEFYTTYWEKEKFNQKFTIVTTISNGFYKGLETVLRTAAILKKNSFSFIWKVIGVSESSKNAILIKKWLGEDYLSNNVNLLGRKTAKEMVEILCDADIFCQTAHIENSPNSLCEAMLLGVPSIASFAGGTNSMLEHGREGYLLQDGDSYSLAGTILEVSQNFDMAKSWGESARQKALFRHDPHRVTQEYLDIYQTITLKE